MPNYAYLSLWFRDFTIEKGAAHLEALLTLFPLSEARPGFRLVIRSLDPGQSPSLEADLLAVPEAVRKLANQFLHDDTAYEVTAHWDLWQAKAGPASGPGWEQRPSPVGLSLQGEEFDDACYRQTGHITLNLGSEHLYLGLPDATVEFARRYVRQNVRLLYAYLRQIEKGLPVAERRLWSEGEADFARRTEQLLAAG